MTGESDKTYPTYLSQKEEQQLQVIRANYDKLIVVLQLMSDPTTRQIIIHIDETTHVRRVQSLREDFHI